MRAVLLTLAALALAAPAAAQDGSEGSVQRTPESAQRFLGEYFAKMPSIGLVWFMTHDGVLKPVRNYQPIEGVGVSGSGKIAEWSAPEPCHSTVDLRDLDLKSGKLNSGEEFNFSLQSHRYEIDWSRVTGVTRADNYSGRGPAVTIGYPAGEVMLPALSVASLEDADRLKFAFAFLKEKCAFKSDTGF